MTLEHPLLRALPLSAISRPSVTAGQAAMLLSLFVVLFDNGAFWRATFAVFAPVNADNLGFALSLLLFLVSLLTIILSLIGFRPLFKPLASLLLITAAGAAYFMDSYGIVIDKSMIQNVMETDSAEAFELFNGSLVIHMLLLGVLPSVWLYRAEIRYRPFRRELLARAVLITVSAAVFAGALLTYYKNFASLSRNNRAIGHMINPVATIGALSSYIGDTFAEDANAPLIPLGEDARLATGWQERGRKNVTILVVGEAARAQNFSLNGYTRETNPRLAEEAVINFTRVSSCGTATAVSLPCMFSHLTRGNYSDGEARRTEGLLKVLGHAGVETFWRENNSGCKGACREIETEQTSRLGIPEVCRDDECYDEVMLHGLEQRLNALEGDAVIVLHQKGSHGPTYYLRYPESAAKFQPLCATNQLQECSRQEVVNAYDNTILYTDRFLDGVIELLKGQSERINTAMLYVSDHGESLGENNLYLHGLPYMIAPETQTHIPMILWLSDGFKQAQGIDEACLRARRDREFSHDHLFHTVLGLMGVETAVHDPALDILDGCQAPLPRSS